MFRLYVEQSAPITGQMPLSLIVDALDPEVSQLEPPTEPMPWCQHEGRRFIQKQPEIKKPLEDLEQAHQEDPDMALKDRP